MLETLLGEETVTGCLSPLAHITLTAEECKLAGIPPGARSFAFAYPVKQLKRLDSQEVLRHANSEDADCRFLLLMLFGGFVYFDDKCEVLQINTMATTGQKTTQLLLLGPALATQKCRNVLTRERRLQPVTLELGDLELFAWVHPSEMFQGQALSSEVDYPDGAFV